MRAREILESVELSSAAQNLMLKMRKGSAVGLNAKLATEIFSALKGWRMENSKALKPSNGGWVLATTPWGDLVKSINAGGRGRDGVITYTARYEDKDPSKMEHEWQKESAVRYAAQYATLRDKIVPLIKANPSKKGRWEVQNLQANESRHGDWHELTVTFEFFVVCSVYQITAPDGQTYEVGGDYKNGAVEETTFQSFFTWAVENTTFMDQVLGYLQMEPLEKKQDPRKPYTPPPTASEETKQIFEVLKTMTNDVRNAQKVHLIEYVTASVGRFMEAINANDKDRAEAIARGFAGLVISQNFHPKTKQLSADWQKHAEKFCENAVEEMQNQFVYKNTRKLASILTAKHSDGNPQVLTINTDRGIITAEIAFSFEDGSSFVVHQSIVQSYAVDGWGRYTNFYRFPTTFHDVKLPGGVKMGLPSEERMNDIFAKA